ncbi:hypothetical protein Nepgr_019999 [Nepenthes gracilis]|uniref:Uncharacterized protein n=1 Tax=Nepenthes gracilis TaxID=150966 RepID=A0AAD3SV47_NEPGR|nr:hypothetical protein Nepgr_019999 [Nepenthes gracilis]
MGHYNGKQCTTGASQQGILSPPWNGGTRRLPPGSPSPSLLIQSPCSARKEIAENNVSRNCFADGYAQV